MTFKLLYQEEKVSQCVIQKLLIMQELLKFVKCWAPRVGLEELPEGIKGG